MAFRQDYSGRFSGNSYNALCKSFNKVQLRDAPKDYLFTDYFLIRSQLLLLQNDEMDLSIPSKLGDIIQLLRRFIHDVPRHIRKSKEHIEDVYRMLIYLHDYISRHIKVYKKFPLTQDLLFLLVNYVELEYEVLYYPKNFTPKYQEEVENRILTFLLTILYDPSTKKRKCFTKPTPVDTCAINALYVVKSVKSEYKRNHNLIENLMSKLLKKLNVLEKMNEIREQPDAFDLENLLRVPKLQQISRYLQKCNFLQDETATSEDEVDAMNVASPLSEIHTDVKNIVCYDQRNRVGIDLNEDFHYSHNSSILPDINVQSRSNNRSRCNFDLNSTTSCSSRVICISDDESDVNDSDVEFIPDEVSTTVISLDDYDTNSLPISNESIKQECLTEHNLSPNSMQAISESEETTQDSYDIPNKCLQHPHTVIVYTPKIFEREVERNAQSIPEVFTCRSNILTGNIPIGNNYHVQEQDEFVINSEAIAATYYEDEPSTPREVASPTRSPIITESITHLTNETSHDFNPEINKKSIEHFLTEDAGSPFPLTTGKYIEINQDYEEHEVLSSTCDSITNTIYTDTLSSNSNNSVWLEESTLKKNEIPQSNTLLENDLETTDNTEHIVTDVVESLILTENVDEEPLSNCWCETELVQDQTSSESATTTEMQSSSNSNLEKDEEHSTSSDGTMTTDKCVVPEVEIRSDVDTDYLLNKSSPSRGEITSASLEAGSNFDIKMVNAGEVLTCKYQIEDTIKNNEITKNIIEQLDKAIEDHDQTSISFHNVSINCEQDFDDAITCHNIASHKTYTHNVELSNVEICESEHLQKDVEDTVSNLGETIEENVGDNLYSLAKQNPINIQQENVTEGTNDVLASNSSDCRGEHLNLEDDVTKNESLSICYDKQREIEENEEKRSDIEDSDMNNRKEQTIDEHSERRSDIEDCNTSNMIIQTNEEQQETKGNIEDDLGNIQNEKQVGIIENSECILRDETVLDDVALTDKSEYTETALNKGKGLDHSDLCDSSKHECDVQGRLEEGKALDNTELLEKSNDFNIKITHEAGELSQQSEHLDARREEVNIVHNVLLSEKSECVANNFEKGKIIGVIEFCEASKNVETLYANGKPLENAQLSKGSESVSSEDMDEEGNILDTYQLSEELEYPYNPSAAVYNEVGTLDSTELSEKSEHVRDYSETIDEQNKTSDDGPLLEESKHVCDQSETKCDELTLDNTELTELGDCSKTINEETKALDNGTLPEKSKDVCDHSEVTHGKRETFNRTQLSEKSEDLCDDSETMDGKSKTSDDGPLLEESECVYNHLEETNTLDNGTLPDKSKDVCDHSEVAHSKRGTLNRTQLSEKSEDLCDDSETMGGKSKTSDDSPLLEESECVYNHLEAQPDKADSFDNTELVETEIVEEKEKTLLDESEGVCDHSEAVHDEGKAFDSTELLEKSKHVYDNTIDEQRTILGNAPLAKESESVHALSKAAYAEGGGLYNTELDKSEQAYNHSQAVSEEGKTLNNVQLSDESECAWDHCPTMLEESQTLDNAKLSEACNDHKLNDCEEKKEDMCHSVSSADDANHHFSDTFYNSIEVQTESEHLSCEEIVNDTDQTSALHEEVPLNACGQDDNNEISNSEPRNFSVISKVANVESVINSSPHIALKPNVVVNVKSVTEAKDEVDFQNHLNASLDDITLSHVEIETSSDTGLNYENIRNDQHEEILSASGGSLNCTASEEIQTVDQPCHEYEIHTDPNIQTHDEDIQAETVKDVKGHLLQHANVSEVTNLHEDLPTAFEETTLTHSNESNSSDETAEEFSHGLVMQYDAELPLDYVHEETVVTESCEVVINDLDVLASVAATKEKIESISVKNSKTKRGRKRKNVKKKSEELPRRITRNSTLSKISINPSDPQDNSKCIPSTFMNLENLVTPPPVCVYNMISNPNTDTEESMDERFSCVENLQNILVNNIAFDEDTLDDGIVFVTQKKIEKEVLISIPESEKDHPAINYDILNEAEEFANLNLSFSTREELCKELKLTMTKNVEININTNTTYSSELDNITILSKPVIEESQVSTENKQQKSKKEKQTPLMPLKKRKNYGRRNLTPVIPVKQASSNNSSTVDISKTEKDSPVRDTVEIPAAGEDEEQSSQENPQDLTLENNSKIKNTSEQKRVLTKGALKCFNSSGEPYVYLLKIPLTDKQKGNHEKPSDDKPKKRSKSQDGDRRHERSNHRSLSETKLKHSEAKETKQLRNQRSTVNSTTGKIKQNRDIDNSVLNELKTEPSKITKRRTSARLLSEGKTQTKSNTILKRLRTRTHEKSQPDQSIKTNMRTRRKSFFDTRDEFNVSAAKASKPVKDEDTEAKLEKSERIEAKPNLTKNLTEVPECNTQLIEGRAEVHLNSDEVSSTPLAQLNEDATISSQVEEFSNGNHDKSVLVPEFPTTNAEVIEPPTSSTENTLSSEKEPKVFPIVCSDEKNDKACKEVVPKNITESIIETTKALEKETNANNIKTDCEISPLENSEKDLEPSAECTTIKESCTSTHLEPAPNAEENVTAKLRTDEKKPEITPKKRKTENECNTECSTEDNASTKKVKSKPDEKKSSRGKNGEVGVEKASVKRETKVKDAHLKRDRKCKSKDSVVENYPGTRIISASKERSKSKSEHRKDKMQLAEESKSSRSKSKDKISINQDRYRKSGSKSESVNKKTEKETSGEKVKDSKSKRHKSKSAGDVNRKTTEPESQTNTDTKEKSEDNRLKLRELNIKVENNTKMEDNIKKEKLAEVKGDTKRHKSRNNHQTEPKSNSKHLSPHVKSKSRHGEKSQSRSDLGKVYVHIEKNDKIMVPNKGGVEISTNKENQTSNSEEDSQVDSIKNVQENEIQKSDRQCDNQDLVVTDSGLSDVCSTTEIVTEEGSEDNKSTKIGECEEIAKTNSESESSSHQPINEILLKEPLSENHIKDSVSEITENLDKSLENVPVDGLPKSSNNGNIVSHQEVPSPKEELKISCLKNKIKQKLKNVERIFQNKCKSSSRSKNSVKLQNLKKKKQLISKGMGKNKLKKLSSGLIVSSRNSGDLLHSKMPESANAVQLKEESLDNNSNLSGMVIENKENAQLKVDLEETPKVDLEETPKVGLAETPKVDVEETPKVDLEETSKVDLEETPKIEGKKDVSPLKPTEEMDQETFGEKSTIHGGANLDLQHPNDVPALNDGVLVSSESPEKECDETVGQEMDTVEQELKQEVMEKDITDKHNQSHLDTLKVPETGDNTVSPIIYHESLPLIQTNVDSSSGAESIHLQTNNVLEKDEESKVECSSENQDLELIKGTTDFEKPAHGPELKEDFESNETEVPETCSENGEQGLQFIENKGIVDEVQTNVHLNKEKHCSDIQNQLSKSNVECSASENKVLELINGTTDSENPTHDPDLTKDVQSDEVCSEIAEQNLQFITNNDSLDELHAHLNKENHCSDVPNQLSKIDVECSTSENKDLMTGTTDSENPAPGPQLKKERKSNQNEVPETYSENGEQNLQFIGNHDNLDEIQTHVHLNKENRCSDIQNQLSKISVECSTSENEDLELIKGIADSENPPQSPELKKDLKSNESEVPETYSENHEQDLQSIENKDNLDEIQTNVHLNKENHCSDIQNQLNKSKVVCSVPENKNLELLKGTTDSENPTHSPELKKDLKSNESDVPETHSENGEQNLQVIENNDNLDDIQTNVYLNKENHGSDIENQLSKSSITSSKVEDEVPTVDNDIQCKLQDQHQLEGSTTAASSVEVEEFSLNENYSSPQIHDVQPLSNDDEKELAQKETLLDTAEDRSMESEKVEAVPVRNCDSAIESEIIVTEGCNVSQDKSDSDLVVEKVSEEVSNIIRDWDNDSCDGHLLQAFDSYRSDHFLTEIVHDSDLIISYEESIIDHSNTAHEETCITEGIEFSKPFEEEEIKDASPQAEQEAEIVLQSTENMNNISCANHVNESLICTDVQEGESSKESSKIVKKRDDDDLILVEMGSLPTQDYAYDSEPDIDRLFEKYSTKPSKHSTDIAKQDRKKVPPKHKRVRFSLKHNSIKTIDDCDYEIPNKKQKLNDKLITIFDYEQSYKKFLTESKHVIHEGVFDHNVQHADQGHLNVPQKDAVFESNIRKKKKSETTPTKKNDPKSIDRIIESLKSKNLQKASPPSEAVDPKLLPADAVGKNVETDNLEKIEESIPHSSLRVDRTKEIQESVTDICVDEKINVEANLGPQCQENIFPYIQDATKTNCLLQIVPIENEIENSVQLLDISDKQTTSTCENTDNLIAVMFSEQNRSRKTGFIFFKGSDHNYHNPFNQCRSIGDPLLGGECDTNESDQSSENKEMVSPELENVLISDTILPYLTDNHLNQESSEDSSADFQLLELIGNTLGRESSPPLAQPINCDYQTNLKYDESSTSTNIEFPKVSNEVFVNHFQQQAMSVENMSELMNVVLTSIQNLNNMTKAPTQHDVECKDIFSNADLDFSDVVQEPQPESLDLICDFSQTQEVASESTVPDHCDYSNLHYLPITFENISTNDSFMNKKVIVEQIPQFIEETVKEMPHLEPMVEKPADLKLSPSAKAKLHMINCPKQKTQPKKQLNNVGFVRNSSKTKPSAPKPKKLNELKAKESEGSESDHSPKVNSSPHSTTIKHTTASVSSGVPKERSLPMIDDFNLAESSKKVVQKRIQSPTQIVPTLPMAKVVKDSVNQSPAGKSPRTPKQVEREFPNVPIQCDMIDNVKRRKRKPVDYSSIEKLLETDDYEYRKVQKSKTKKDEKVKFKQKEEDVNKPKSKVKTPIHEIPASTVVLQQPVNKSKTTIFEDSDDDIPKKKKLKSDPPLEPDAMNALFDELVKEGNVNNALAKTGTANKVAQGPPKLTPIFPLDTSLQKKSETTPVKQIGVVNPIPRQSNNLRKEPPNRNSYSGDDNRASSQYYPYYDRNRRSYPYSSRESSRSSHQGSSRRTEYPPHSSDQRYLLTRSSSSRSSRSSRHHSNSRSTTEQRDYWYGSNSDLAWREDMKKKFPHMFKDEVFF